MPYIAKTTRETLERYTDLNQTVYNMHCAGDLNYTITRLCHEYVKKFGEKYQTYNDIMGVLEGAKLELYRRKIAPYEDLKIAENGDV